MSASRLWEAVREDQAVASYDVFTLTLSMLYALGVVEFADGMLTRTTA
jgi:hypothetical protein